MKKAFTLIELLVVVLIIGILAAVALPQYQKAVEKSKATQALTLLKSVGQSFEVYFLANSEYAHSFDDLDVDISWTGHTKFLSFEKDTRSNGEWSLGIEDSSGYTILRLGRIKGKYKGAEFHFTYATPTKPYIRGAPIRCGERKTNGNFLFDTSLEDGAYCTKIMNATLTGEDPWTRSYQLPNT